MVENNNTIFIFNDLHQAIHYYRFKNPARAKYKNLLEAETSGNSYVEELSGKHPNDIWASVAYAIKFAMKHYPIDWQKAFSMCDLALNRVHPQEAASELGYTVRMINKMRYRIKEDLTRELKRRELLNYND
jgi:hypothetical protein